VVEGTKPDDSNKGDFEQWHWEARWEEAAESIYRAAEAGPEALEAEVVEGCPQPGYVAAAARAAAEEGLGPADR
jgi:hypothetical protein